MNHRITVRILVAAAAVGCAAGAAAQNDEELAKKLNNPVAAMISIPLQSNYDSDFGPQRQGRRFTLNVQPVIPVTLNAEWNLISRTIVPIIDQHDVVPGTKQSGLGDITQSLFFSPARPTAGGLIWGVGPVFFLPTGSDDALSARKWGLGPTVVALKQDGPWTFGVLANHIWSVAGDDSRADISSTFLQPFLSHTTKTAWTYNLNTESTYDWKASQWSVPLNATISKLMRFGQQPVSIGGTVRYWLETPDTGPHGWGFRFTVTFLVPR
jgi:hypothetical protein